MTMPGEDSNAARAQASPANTSWQAAPAKALGYAGAAVIPALFLVSWLNPNFMSWTGRLSVVYGATILSFLGGIQWGFAVNHGLAAVGMRRLVTSVIPSLWAAVSLTLPITLCAFALIVGFVLLLAYEWLERRDNIYPPWYLPLRLRLTTIIVFSLALFVLP